jgi:DNA-binding winged helix-turn-helix (wHTH) protein/tetratricopeptide (TPR) repeat protein
MNERRLLIYCFGRFRFIPARHELWHGDQRVELEPRCFDLLRVVLEHRDRVLSKDELIAHVWDKTDIATATVDSALSRLRKQLGNGDQDVQWIVTIPKVGVKWSDADAVVVEESNGEDRRSLGCDTPGDDATDSAGSDASPGTATPPVAPHSRSSAWRPVLIVAAACALLLALFAMRDGRRQADVPQAPVPARPAVVLQLPFSSNRHADVVLEEVATLTAAHLRDLGVSAAIEPLPMGVQDAPRAGVRVRLKTLSQNTGLREVVVGIEGEGVERGFAVLAADTHNLTRILAGRIAAAVPALGPRNEAISTADPMVLGNYYREIRRYEDAKRLFEKINRDDPRNSDAAIDYAQALYLSGDQYTALEVLDKVIAATEAYDEPMQKVRALTIKAQFFAGGLPAPEARKFVQQARAIRNIPDYCRVRIDVIEAGILQQEHEYEAAARLFKSAIPVMISVGDTDGAAVAMGNLGLGYANDGRYQEALDYYEQSIRLFRKSGGVRQLIVLLGNAANVARYLKDDDKSHSLLREAYGLSQSEEYSSGYSAMILEYAMALMARGDMGEAESVIDGLRRHAEHGPESGFRYWLAKSTLESLRGRGEAAAEALAQARTIADTSGIETRNTTYHYIEASVSRQRGQPVSQALKGAPIVYEAYARMQRGQWRQAAETCVRMINEEHRVRSVLLWRDLGVALGHLGQDERQTLLAALDYPQHLTRRPMLRCLLDGGSSCAEVRPATQN